MLFSNFLDNVPKFSAFADSVSIEKCYQSMCERIKSLSGDDTSSFEHDQHVPMANHHQFHPNHNRIRWKNVSLQKSKRVTHHYTNQLAHQHQRTLMPHTLHAVILFFIVLLSFDQTTTVYGARSRDSFNSIYQSNNLSVNNVIKTGTNTSAAIDMDMMVNHIDDELPIDTFVNVTNDDEFERLLRLSEFSRSNKQKRDPIYQNEFAVYVPGGNDVADQIASKHGFTNMGQVS